jgi:hypothetical protein
MKVGIDLDGTITDAPALFSLLTHALLGMEGNEVHIITYRDMLREDVEDDLQRYNIRYTRLHLPKPDDDAPEWKSRLATELDLDIMFEDSPEILEAMPSKVKRFWLCDPDIFDLPSAIAGMRANMRIDTIE